MIARFLTRTIALRMKLLIPLLIAMTSLTSSAADLQSIPLKTIDGKDATLKDYAGKTVLIVNVASECGYTGQYAGLQALHEVLKAGIQCARVPVQRLRRPGTGN